MTAFLVLAGLLAGLAVLFVVRPLLRVGPDGSRGPLLVAVTAGVLLPLAAFALYAKLSSYDWTGDGAAAGVPDVSAMMATLEQRLKEHPDDVAGWQMLGRSYLVLNNFPRAIAAYEHAYTLTGGKDAEVDTSLAEALAMQAGQTIDARAAGLFEDALKADPQNPRALWYGGIVALNAGNRALARERWAAVLALGPPPEVARALAMQLNRLDGAMGRAPDPTLVALAALPEPGGDADGAGGAGGAVRGEATAAVEAAPGDPSATVHVRVSAAPALAAKLAGRTLFVFAQDPDRPGPPLAVKRFPPGTALPLDIDLSAADAMMPTRTLASVKRAKLVARLSASGQPLPASGDLAGEVQAVVGDATRLGVVIDHELP